jgi:hypothetical protein
MHVEITKKNKGSAFTMKECWLTSVTPYHLRKHHQQYLAKMEITGANFKFVYSGI